MPEKPKKLREQINNSAESTAEWYDLPENDENGSKIKETKTIRSISDYDSESVSSSSTTRNSWQKKSNWLKIIQKVNNHEIKKIPREGKKFGGQASNYPVPSNAPVSKIAENSYFSNIESVPDMKPRKYSLATLMEQMKFEVHPDIPMQKSTLGDEELKLHVYKNALKAMLYPVSWATPHKFESWSSASPTFCCECEGLMWGLSKQGVHCVQCGIKCHDKCKDLLNADCLQRTVDSSRRRPSADIELKAEKAKHIMIERMKLHEENQPETFDLIRDAFGIDDATHQNAMKSAKQSILDGDSHWSANITITVISAQGLTAKDSSGTSDPYVVVQVGRVKKQTRTIRQELNPVWNETFSFQCHNSTDRIKIRVWDEDYDLRSKVRHHFTKESDDFLGQTIIEVRTLAGEMDVWYQLEKRTYKSTVSGAIRLKIQMEIAGEKPADPFHQQYACLHEVLFQYLCQRNGGLVPIPKLHNIENWKIYFEKVPQEIADEFAVRYGIESIYQAMIHFSLLCTRYKSPSVAALMSNLLAHINEFYCRLTASLSESAKDRFFASNFGSDRFVQLLDSLYKSIQLDLSAYRNEFPSLIPERLQDLKYTIDLLTSITFFRLKVQELKNIPRSCAVVQECVVACLKSTYKYLFANCIELYRREIEPEPFAATTSTPPDDGENQVDFFAKLLVLMVSVIEEDKTIYQPVINQFSDVKIGEISAKLMWQLYSFNLKYVLEDHADSPRVELSDYINLYFKVKLFYGNYIAELMKDSNSSREFPAWFHPFINQWLEIGTGISLARFRTAYTRDNESKFARVSDHSTFSCSVVDVFTELNDCYKVLSRLEISTPQMWNAYMRQFSQTIDQVLRAYSDLVKRDFAQCATDQTLAITLMNNVQQLRIELDRLYRTMIPQGKFEPDVQRLFIKLQKRLNLDLIRLADIFTQNIGPQIYKSMRTLAAQLNKIKKSGGGVLKEDQLAMESDFILEPLMEFLDVQLVQFAESCEPTVLKKILMDLWQILMTSIEKVVVLPSVAEKSETGNKEDKILSVRQCTVLKRVLEMIMRFFHGGGFGLKDEIMTKSFEMWKLTFALDHYTNTTDSLIKKFIETQKGQDEIAEDDPVGQISVQLDLSTHPGTGSHRVMTKLVVANDIRWQNAGAFKPFIEIHIVGPYLADKKRKFSTASKTNTWKPKFNETFCLDLGNEDEPQNYEIIFQLRDYSILKENRLVGIGLLQLREIFQSTEASYSGWIQLGKQLQIDEAGMILLRILSQRQNDEIAKEFVKLKLARQEVEATLRHAYSTQSLLEMDRISLASKLTNKASMM